MKTNYVNKTKVLTCLTALTCATTLAQDGQPKLFEPYAPKPSGRAPEVWEIRILEGSQVENSAILNNKKEIKVTVPAYELVPKQASTATIIKDPGFEPALSTSQKTTIGAVLTEYSEQTGELQNRLEKITRELEKGLGEIAREVSAPKKAEPTEKKPTDEKKKSNSTSR